MSCHLSRNGSILIWGISRLFQLLFLMIRFRERRTKWDLKITDNSTAGFQQIWPTLLCRVCIYRRIIAYFVWDLRHERFQKILLSASEKNVQTCAEVIHTTTSSSEKLGTPGFLNFGQRQLKGRVTVVELEKSTSNPEGSWWCLWLHVNSQCGLSVIAMNAEEQ